MNGLKKTDFVIIKKGLIPDYMGDIPEKKNIFVDLDSVLSILLTSNDKIPDNPKNKLNAANAIIENFIEFLNMHIKYSKVIFFYRLEKSEYFKSIYKDWQIEREKRYENDDVINFLHKILINKLRKIKITNLEIVKCNDATILTMNEYLKEYKPKDTVIHSRDPHYLCLFYYHSQLMIYDGKTYMTGRNYHKTRSKLLPNINSKMLPYYFLICGMKRNDYPGIEKYGTIKTVNYLLNNFENIIDGKDELIKKVEKYKKIFLLNEKDE